MALVDSTSPSSVVLAALACYASRDWTALAAFADPLSVAVWRDEYFDAHIRLPTLERLRQEHPDAPDAALQRLLDAELLPKRQRFLDRFEDHLSGIKTEEDFEQLSPTELLVRYWRAWDPHAQIRRMYAAAGQPLPPAFDDSPRVREFAIVSVDPIDAGVVAVTWSDLKTDEEGTRWLLRQQPDGAWRILVDAAFLCLSHETVAYLIDDPNLAAYVQRAAKASGADPAA